jgi:hypothetical protein
MKTGHVGQQKDANAGETFVAFEMPHVTVLAVCRAKA